MIFMPTFNTYAHMHIISKRVPLSIGVKIFERKDDKHKYIKMMKKIKSKAEVALKILLK